MAPSAGPPIVDDAHIFCGHVRQPSNAPAYATGFHSRPGGINPVTAAGAAIIGNGAIGPTAMPAPPGIYRLNNFTVTMNGVTAPKQPTYSTMFPDTCGMASVLTAIRNAFAAAVTAGYAPPGPFNGMSGGGGACTAGGGAQFNIRGRANAQGDIMTAYPDY